MTGEDVSNALYYIHLDHPDDELLAPPRPLHHDEASPRSSGESQRSQIKRKPLPASARVGASSHDPDASSALAECAPNPRPNSRGVDQSLTSLTPLAILPTAKDDSITVQKGVQFLDIPTEIPAKSYSAPSSPRMTAIHTRPRPNGPRSPGSSYPNPPNTDFDTILNPSFATSAMRSPSPMRIPLSSSSNSVPPPLPPRPSDIIPSLPPRPNASSLASGPQSFRLTLIRRDPTTGGQWTVAKVTSIQNGASPSVPQHGNSENFLAERNTVKSTGHPINITVLSSGYAKFRGMPSRETVSVHRLSTSNAQSLPPSIRERAQQIVEADEDIGSSEGFNRQVRMAYSKGLRAGLKERWHKHNRNRSDAEGSPARSPSSWGQHTRQDSMNSISSNDSTNDHPSSPTVIYHPAPGYRPSGYIFRSPWSGRCEFRTGNAGRSLKLRHILPDAQSTPDPDPMKQVFGPGAAPVSELRFNLPNADLFGPGKRGKIARDAQDKFSRYIRRESASSESSDEREDDWETEMMEDMGREDAGGGNRGKRAKMGKLIVHDEGIKMIDLVVAANMGVWWSSWERSSAE